jgi:hypothetical protein
LLTTGWLSLSFLKVRRIKKKIKIKKFISVMISICLVVESAFAADGTFTQLNSILQSAPQDGTSNNESPPHPGQLNKEHQIWLESLDKSIEGSGAQHPLDSFGLLQWNTYPGDSNRSISPMGIKVELADQANKAIEEYMIGDFFNSTHSNTYWKSKLGITSEKKLSLHYKNQKIHELLPSLLAVTVYGDFLVFIEKNHYSHSEKKFLVSFVDLGYFAPALGKTNLPIFRIPVHAESDVLSKFEINSGLLNINDFKLSESMIREGFSEPQRLAFNITSALSDPKDVATLMPFAERLMDSFIESSKLVESQLNPQQSKPETAFIDNLKVNLNTVVKEEESLRNLKTGNTSAQLEQGQQELFQRVVQKTIANDETYKKILGSVQSQSVKTQSLIGTISALFFQLSAPRPLGANSIVAALVHTAKGLQGLKWQQTKEGLLQLSHHRLVKWGGPMVAAALLGSLYPDAVSAFYFQAVDMTRVILEQTYGRTHDMLILGKEAMSATFAGLKPEVIYSAYFTPEKFPKLAVGFTAIITQLYMALGLPHLIVNSIKLGRDLAHWDWKQYDGLSIIKKIRQSFIDRQNKEQQEYVKLLADEQSENKNNNESILGVTAAERERRVIEMVNQLEAQDRQDMKLYYFFTDLFKRKEKTLKANSLKIESFAGALRHFLFSFSAFTNSGYWYGKIWNYYFIFRSFFWYTFTQPKLLLTMIYQPKYFQKIVFANSKGMHIPTIYNGGTDSWLRIVNQVATLNKPMLENVKNFEANVVGLESKVVEMVLKKSLLALAQYSANDTELKNILVANGGVQTLTDPVIERLSQKQKTFYRTFVNTAFEETMGGVLKQMLGQSFNGSNNSANEFYSKADKLDLKFALANSPERFQWSEALVIDQVDSVFLRSYDKALDLSQKSMWNFEVARNNSLQGNIAKLDPANNRQVGRYKVAANQLDKPKAVARAVRNMITSNIVDKPMELLFAFVLTAGITSGILAPIQPEMFSADSWFYLSRVTFVNGFVTGLVFSVLADVWSKVQQDERLDSQGVFNDIPEEAPKKGFWNAYRDALKDPNNKLWDNQKFYLKIIWANVPAALISIGLMQFISLGRFDFDLYITGYLLGLLPFNPGSGLGFKTENAFEIAAKWIAQRVPKDLRSHPMAIEYVTNANLKRRALYNFYYKIFENSVGKAFDVFQSMTVPEFGSRSFSRILFGGYTLNEAASSLMNVIKNFATLQTKYIAEISAAFYAAYASYRLTTENKTVEKATAEKIVENPKVENRFDSPAANLRCSELFH